MSSRRKGKRHRRAGAPTPESRAVRIMGEARWLRFIPAWDRGIALRQRFGISNLASAYAVAGDCENLVEALRRESAP